MRNLIAYFFLLSNATHLVMQHASKRFVELDILGLECFEIFKIKYLTLLIKLFIKLL